MENEKVVSVGEMLQGAVDSFVEQIENAVGSIKDRYYGELRKLDEVRANIRSAREDMNALSNVVYPFASALMVTAEDLADSVLEMDDMLDLIEEPSVDEDYEEDYEDEDNVPDGYYEDEEDESVEDETVED